MDLYYYLCLGGLVLAPAAAFLLSKKGRRPEEKRITNICMGAIRVTREGRDMLIVRKEDGSFEMIEEEPARKQCLTRFPLSE